MSLFIALLALLLVAPAASDSCVVNIPLDPQSPQYVYDGWTIGQGQGWRACGEAGTIQFNAGKASYMLITTVYNDSGKPGKLSYFINDEPVGAFVRGTNRPEGFIQLLFPVNADVVKPGCNVLKTVTDPTGHPIAIQQFSLLPLRDKAAEKLEILTLTGWNSNATRYMIPPVIECNPLKGAAFYRLQLVTDDGKSYDLNSRTPEFNLQGIWRKLRHGLVTCILTAQDSQNLVVGVGHVNFRKAHQFDNQVPQYQRPVKETVEKLADFLVNYRNPKAYEPSRTPLIWHASRKLNNDLQGESFPAHQHAVHIEFLIDYAAYTGNPVMAKRAIKLANELAEWNLEHGTPADWKYPFMFYSTAQAGKMGGGVDGDSLMPTVVPCMGRALLRLGISQKNPRYVKAAWETACGLVSTQTPEGNWPFRVEPKTGRIVNPYSSNIISTVLFFDELIQSTKVPDGIDKGMSQKVMDSRDKAIKWIIDRPLKDYRWEGMWEDIGNTHPYVNLEFYDAALTAKYLIQNRSKYPQHYNDALKLVKWVEDQFVCWHADDASVQLPWVPIIPTVLEQYVCYWPIDFHVAHAIDLFMSVYGVTNDESYLRKSKALASSLIRAQRKDGSIATWMWYADADKAADNESVDFGDWFRCMNYDGHILMKYERELSE